MGIRALEEAEGHTSAALSDQGEGCRGEEFSPCFLPTPQQYFRVISMSTNSQPNTAQAGSNLSFFEKYLTVWVFLCILAGIALGRLFPQVAVNWLIKPFTMVVFAQFFLGWLFRPLIVGTELIRGSEVAIANSYIAGTETFRRVRDEVKERVIKLIADLT
jgi:hypothetical protein